MIKRTTAFLFLSMAYLIIMAHAVVPHHHHNERMCIQHSHCAAGHQGHEKSTSEHDHENDCLLLQLVVRPASQENQDSEPECLLQWQTEAGLPDDAEGLMSRSVPFRGPLIFQAASSYILFASAALVMRAPPAA